MQMVLGRVRGYSERPIDRLECIPDPGAQHMRGGQQAKRDFVLRVGVERAGDDVGCLVKAPGAQQQLAGMQRVLPIAGRERRARSARATASSGSSRANLRPDICRKTVLTPGAISPRASNSLLHPRIGLQSRTGRRRERRIQTSPDRVRWPCRHGELRDRAVRRRQASRSRDGGLRPIGDGFSESFVGRRGFLVAPGIAEPKDAEIGYFFLRGPQLEGDAGAFGGVLRHPRCNKASLEPAIEDREFVLGNFALSEINRQASMKSAAAPNGRALPIASSQISSKSVTVRCFRAGAPFTSNKR